MTRPKKTNSKTILETCEILITILLLFYMADEGAATPTVLPNI